MTGSPSADDLYLQAIRYSELNRYQEWLEFCNLALMVDPTHAPALVLRGKGHVEMGDPTRALTDFETAIGINPKLGEAYYGRAWVKGLGGDWDGEIADATLAMTLDPSLTLLYYRRMGHAYSGKGDIAQGIEYYNRVLDVEPNNAGTLFNRAGLYLQQRNYEQALSDLQRIVRFQPTWSWALRERGRAYMGLNELQKARDDFNRAIRYAPDDADSYYWRGKCHERLGDLKQATLDFAYARRLDPTYPDRHV
jgi:tetratricopeptide (TPR) repeat protein